jgi:hypothetical protein
MKRVDLETAPAEVREFVEGLPAEPGGFEFALGGKVIWQLKSPAEASSAEWTAQLARGREIVERVRQQVKGVPKHELESEIRSAVEEVRRHNP